MSQTNGGRRDWLTGGGTDPHVPVMTDSTPGPGRRHVPLTALILSLAALAVPIAAPPLVPSRVVEYQPLIWLTALVPAFLFSYYRGWLGAATALAAGMAALALGQVVALLAGLETGDAGLLLAVIIIYVLVTLVVGWGAELLHSEREQAESAALTDPLTRLPNRRHTLLLLEREFEAARRGRALSVALFDLDHFKQYNDRWGHSAGDEALTVFAEVLDGCTRRMNLSGRVGGEEFLAVLGDADRDAALRFVERVRAALAQNPPSHTKLTVSVGVAEFNLEMRSIDDLLRAADRALYQAKEDGRNCVRVADPFVPG